MKRTVLNILTAILAFAAMAQNGQAPSVGLQDEKERAKEMLLKQLRAVYGDSAYYYLVNEPSWTEWTFFVNPSINQGWEHECYIAKGPNRMLAMPSMKISIDTIMRPPSFPLELLWAPVREELSMEEINVIPSPLTNEERSAAQRTFAVILSGGGNMFMNEERYWNDCAFIYRTLVRRYGIPKDNITALISDGDDPLVDMALIKGGYASSPTDLDEDGEPDVKYAATLANVKLVFEDLQSKMQADDHLFIFVIDHGGLDSQGIPFILMWGGGHLTNLHLSTMIKPLIDKKVTINAVMGQCNSGGFVSTLSQDGCVVATACAEDEPSYASSNLQFDEFVYHWTTAVNGARPSGLVVKADFNKDGHVSMLEAFNYAKANDKFALPGSQYIETPQYSSYPLTIGRYLSFDKLCESDLYVKDNSSDSGEEPNTTTSIFWDSPSIWVRNQPDNGVEHENPEFSWDHQQAFVYFRVHNRGTKPYYGNGMWAHLYWAKASTAVSDKTWKGREVYNGSWITGDHMEACGLNKRIEPGGSEVFMARWSLPNLMEEDADGNFHYCIALKLLDTSYDDGYQEGKVYFQIADRNKQAQKNLTIIRKQDIFNGVKVFVRNTVDDNAKYRLELSPRTNRDLEFFSKHQGTVDVEMSPLVYSAWERGGSQSLNCEVVKTITGGPTKKVRFLGANSKLKEITFNKAEFDSVKITFRFKNLIPDTNDYYVYDLIQKDDLGNVIGGETFKVEIPKPTLNLTTSTSHVGDDCYELSVNDVDLQSIVWLDSQGDTVGCDKTILVAPTLTQQSFTVNAVNADGEYGTKKVTLPVQHYLKELSYDGGSEQSLVVELSQTAPELGSISIVSVSDNSRYINTDIPKGAKTVFIEWGSLRPGLYAVSYLIDGNIVDTKKLTKK